MSSGEQAGAMSVASVGAVVSPWKNGKFVSPFQGSEDSEPRGIGAASLGAAVLVAVAHSHFALPLTGKETGLSQWRKIGWANLYSPSCAVCFCVCTCR